MIDLYLSILKFGVTAVLVLKSVYAIFMKYTTSSSNIKKLVVNNLIESGMSKYDADVTVEGIEYASKDGWYVVLFNITIMLYIWLS